MSLEVPVPSEKPTRILQSKTDLSAQEIARLSDAEAWQIIYSFRSEKIRDDRLQICFTGFGASKKRELSALAQSAHLKVVGSVTKNLDFLCAGETAGPKKVEKAIEQGVQFLSEADFKELLESGELPGRDIT